MLDSYANRLESGVKKCLNAPWRVARNYNYESMAGYSSLYGREISKKIRHIDYETFIEVLKMFTLNTE